MLRNSARMLPCLLACFNSRFTGILHKSVIVITLIGCPVEDAAVSTIYTRGTECEAILFITFLTVAVTSQVTLSD